MANRTKTERNQRIWDLYQKGWRHKSIANMMKMTLAAVSQAIYREKKRRGILTPTTSHN